VKTTTLRRAEVTLDLGQGIREELLGQWGTGDAVCVGHAWDGVIWGRISSRRLSIPYDTRPGRGAQLRWETLLDLRIFDERREIRIWRRGNALEAVEVTDSSASQSGEAYYRDLDFELIRSPGSRPSDGEFVELKGLAGQVHYPPGPVPAKLRVRLYYQADPTSGLVRSIENRLVALVPRRQRS
jgi:CRISPR-associated protein (TIGR03984 family)